MTTAVGRPLHLRLFLEGVEIPVIGAVIQSQKNVPVSCAIQIPANDYALDLLPRTLVHLYALDFYGTSSQQDLAVAGEGVSVWSSEDDPEAGSALPPERFETTAYQEHTDLVNQGYKLIFGGELHGVSFSKSPQSRAVFLQCLDFSNYWDTVFQYQISGMSLGGGNVRSSFSGLNASLFHDMFRGSGDIITELISTAPRSFPHMGGTLLGGLMNIIEAVGGTYFGTRAVRGVNDFFSLAEMRLHLTQMVGANPYRQGDESRLLHAQGFDGLFRRSLSGLGREVSIRKILLALQRYIFHEVVPINAPRYVPPEYDPNLPRTEMTRLDQGVNTRTVATAANDMKQHFDSLKDRQLACSTPARADRESDRRGGLRTELQALMRQANRAATAAQTAATENGIASGLASVVAGFKTIQQLLARMLFLVQRGQRVEITKHTFWLVPSTQATETLNILDAAISTCNRILQTEYPRRIRRTTNQPDPPPRLLSQLYVPDVWMVAPPRCNVIFPEQYSQFSYGRNYTQETTRLLLRTNDAFYGSDFLFDSYYMVPSNLLGTRTLQRIGRGAVNRDRAQTDAPVWFRRDMMEHELFTGIVPAFERMTELNLHAIRGGETQIDGVRVPYAILAANHIFFQYRFRTRTLQLSGPYNPYVVLGFPALVIDKPHTLEELAASNNNMAFAADLAERVREGDGQYGAITEDQRQAAIEANDTRVAEVTLELLADRPRTHYMGTPNLISHSLDVNTGGTTQIQMEYARTNNERAEFFGDNFVQPRASRVATRQRTSTVACLRAPVAGNIGYLGGEITGVTDVTDQYTRRSGTGRSRRSTDTQRLPMFVPNTRSTGRIRRGTQVPVGVSRPAREYGPEVVALVGTGGEYSASNRSESYDLTQSTELLVEFRAYRITETVGAYRMESRPLPPEDYTFPPWYGDDYRTDRVGGLYSYFFGTGSIVDPTVVLEPGATPEQYSAEDSNERQAFLTMMRAQVDSVMAGGVPLGGNQVLEEGDDVIGPPPTMTSTTIGEVPERAPIAFAVEELVRTYSRIKINKYDVHDFVRAYTWRPIATMVDVFGTANLEITDQGEVVRGVEGFHSRAFGDFDDLRQLVGPADGVRPRTILGISTQNSDETSGSTGTAEQISARLDTRKEKRIQVLKYLYRQLSASGIRG